MKYLITDRDFFELIKYPGFYVVKMYSLTTTTFCREVSDNNLVNLTNYETTEFVNRLCKTTIHQHNIYNKHNIRVRENDDIIVIRILSRIQDLTAEDLIELNKEKLIEYYKIETRKLW